MIMIIYTSVYYSEVDMFDSVVIVTKVGYMDQHDQLLSRWLASKRRAICISSEKFLMCHGQYMIYDSI